MSPRKFPRLAGLVAAGFLLAAVPARAGFLDNRYTAGHADIAVAYDAGQLFLHYHFGSNAVVNGTPLSTDAEFDHGDATTIVPQSWSSGSQSSPFPRPAGSQWDFIGNAAGDPVWILPQTSVSGVPFLGIATDDLDPADWTGPITWSVTGLNYTGPGNGQFSTRQQGLSNPTVFASTADGLPDSWTQGTGSHDHFFYGFTALGTYDVQFTASGTHATDGLRADTATFRFQVGPQAVPEPPQVVPEPSSLALLGSGVGAAALVRAWRRKKGVPVTTA